MSGFFRPTFFVTALFAFAIGCGPPKKPPTPDPGPTVRVWDVSLGNLMRQPELYQSPDPKRTVNRVRVSVPAGSYIVVRDEVRFCFPRPDSPPAIVFHCDLLVVGEPGGGLTIVGEVRESSRNPIHVRNCLARPDAIPP